MKVTRTFEPLFHDTLGQKSKCGVGWLGEDDDVDDSHLKY